MEDEILDNNSSSRSFKSKVRGLSDFIAIIRDRWLLSAAISLPIALGYVYIKYQETEYYQSASFRLVPPPVVLNLQKVIEKLMLLLYPNIWKIK